MSQSTSQTSCPETNITDGKENTKRKEAEEEVVKEEKVEPVESLKDVTKDLSEAAKSIVQTVIEKIDDTIESQVEIEEKKKVFDEKPAVDEAVCVEKKVQPLGSESTEAKQPNTNQEKLILPTQSSNAQTDKIVAPAPSTNADNKVEIKSEKEEENKLKEMSSSKNDVGDSSVNLAKGAEMKNVKEETVKFAKEKEVKDEPVEPVAVNDNQNKNTTKEETDKTIMDSSAAKVKNNESDETVKIDKEKDSVTNTVDNSEELGKDAKIIHLKEEKQEKTEEDVGGKETLTNNDSEKTVKDDELKNKGSDQETNKVEKEVGDSSVELGKDAEKIIDMKEEIQEKAISDESIGKEEIVRDKSDDVPDKVKNDETVVENNTKDSSDNEKKDDSHKSSKDVKDIVEQENTVEDLKAKDTPDIKKNVASEETLKLEIVKDVKIEKNENIEKNTAEVIEEKESIEQVAEKFPPKAQIEEVDVQIDPKDKDEVEDVSVLPPTQSIPEDQAEEKNSDVEMEEGEIPFIDEKDGVLEDALDIDGIIVGVEEAPLAVDDTKTAEHTEDFTTEEVCSQEPSEPLEDSNTNKVEENSNAEEDLKSKEGESNANSATEEAEPKLVQDSGKGSSKLVLVAVFFAFLAMVLALFLVDVAAIARAIKPQPEPKPEPKPFWKIF